MKTTAYGPIGIFDSGLGGLTIAKAVQKRLPNEKIIYFGDTLNFPYGEKTPADIRKLCFNITRFLLAQQCKIVLIACNTATTAAADYLRKTFIDGVIFIDVVEPLVLHLQQHYQNKTIGLIGTTRTVQSNYYQQKLHEHCKKIRLTAVATPLLAPAIENNLDGSAMMALLKQYLSSPSMQAIDALVLGCTHYPLIYSQFVEFYQNQVHIIDSSDLIAHFTQQLLMKENLLNSIAKNSNDEFYVSCLSKEVQTKIKQLMEGEQPFVEIKIPSPTVL